MRARIVLVMLLAVGCGGPAAVPRALPPVPVASAPATRESAAEFVRSFVQRLDAAYQLGRPYPLSGLVDDRCRTCRELAGYADSMARAGRRVVGPSFTDLTAEAAPIEGDQVYVSLTARAPARREVNDRGRVLRSDPDAGRLRWTVVVLRRDGGWRLRAVLKDPQ